MGVRLKVGAPSVLYTMFRDEHSFDAKRLLKYCVPKLLPDGHAVPSCAYNNLGYRKQVNLMEGGMKPK